MTGLIIAYFVVAALVFVLGIVMWAMSRPFEDERHLTRTGARMVVGCLVWPWLLLVLVRTYAMALLRDSQARLDEIMAPARVTTTTCVDMETRVALLNEGYDTAIAQHMADDPERAEEWLDGKLAIAWAEGHESGFWNGRASQQHLPNDATEILLAKEHALKHNPYTPDGKEPTNDRTP